MEEMIEDISASRYEMRRSRVRTGLPSWSDLREPHRAVFRDLTRDYIRAIQSSGRWQIVPVAGGRREQRQS